MVFSTNLMNATSQKEFATIELLSLKLLLAYISTKHNITFSFENLDYKSSIYRSINKPTSDGWDFYDLEIYYEDEGLFLLDHLDKSMYDTFDFCNSVCNGEDEIEEYIDEVKDYFYQEASNLVEMAAYCDYNYDDNNYNIYNIQSEVLKLEDSIRESIRENHDWDYELTYKYREIYSHILDEHFRKNVPFASDWCSQLTLDSLHMLSDIFGFNFHNVESEKIVPFWERCAYSILQMCNSFHLSCIEDSSREYGLFLFYHPYGNMVLKFLEEQPKGSPYDSIKEELQNVSTYLKNGCPDDDQNWYNYELIKGDNALAISLVGLYDTGNSCYSTICAVIATYKALIGKVYMENKNYFEKGV